MVFLPLKKSEVRHVAVIGPSANDAYAMGGDYTGVPCNTTTFFKGMQAYVAQTTFASGCKDVSCNSLALVSFGYLTQRTKLPLSNGNPLLSDAP